MALDKHLAARVLSRVSLVLLCAYLLFSAIPLSAGTGFVKYNWKAANLPSTCVASRPYWVSDGLSDSDCATGGGSTFVLCLCDAGGTSFSAFAVSGSGDVTQVGSMLSGAAFADSSADDQCLGLTTTAGGAGAICFDNQSTDEVIVYGDLGVGLADPVADFHVQSGVSGVTITTAYEMALEGSGNTDFVIATPDASEGTIWFAAASDTSANIKYDYDDADGPKISIESGASGVIDLLRHDGSVAVRIDTSGNLQIGGDSNNYKLQLAETDSPGTCDSTARGRMYYDISEGHPCTCNGTNWVDGVGTTCS